MVSNCFHRVLIFGPPPPYRHLLAACPVVMCSNLQPAGFAAQRASPTPSPWPRGGGWLVAGRTGPRNQDAVLFPRGSIFILFALWSSDLGRLQQVLQVLVARDALAACVFALVPILFILLLCPGAVFCSRRWETPARLRQPKSPASPQGPRSGWLAPGGQAKRPDSRAAPPFCILFRGDGGRSSFGNKREAARVRQGALIVLLLHLDLFRFCELGLSLLPSSPVRPLPWQRRVYR